MTDYTKKPCKEYKAHGSSKLPCETCGFLWEAHDRRVRSFTQRRAETNRVNIRRDIDMVAAVLNSWPDTVSKGLARNALDRLANRLANRLARVTDCTETPHEAAQRVARLAEQPVNIRAMLGDNETHDLGVPKEPLPKDPPIRDHWCYCIVPKPTRDFERRMTVCEICTKEVLP